MDKVKAKILILVEGPKTDTKLMNHLLEVYGINQSHQIVSYNTNIYALYNQMFRDNDPRDIDLLQLLKEHEKNPEAKKIFDEYYSDILLIFDLDPQDPLYSEDKIKCMMEYFVESSDMGKLYLNYPMVEAFYHMKSIPDADFPLYTATYNELCNGWYKKRVSLENRNHDYTKFAINRSECNTVIHQNIDKACMIVGSNRTFPFVPESIAILNSQIKKLRLCNEVYVLCTCAFYIADYNPKLLMED